MLSLVCLTVKTGDCVSKIVVYVSSCCQNNNNNTNNHNKHNRFIFSTPLLISFIVHYFGNNTNYYVYAALSLFLSSNSVCFLFCSEKKFVWKQYESIVLVLLLLPLTPLYTIRDGKNDTKLLFFVGIQTNLVQLKDSTV